MNKKAFEHLCNTNYTIGRLLKRFKSFKLKLKVNGNFTTAIIDCGKYKQKIAQKFHNDAINEDEIIDRIIKLKIKDAVRVITKTRMRVDGGYIYYYEMI